MQARRLMLITTLTLGLSMNHPSAALSLPSNQVPHNGMSPQVLERAYIESYEQSGFRLASRHKESNASGNTWTIELVFHLTSVPKEPNAPGTTLTISGGRQTVCSCSLSRESYMAPNAHNPDPAVFARGYRVLIKADTAALAKVRQRLGVGLPVLNMPISPDSLGSSARPLLE
ncbi:hypothetical protein [Xanthomonas arboricola]|uniref:hypothetical protein n=1 Tax=Xanthomonas arboricola TaxID=56448 RepID=UPI0011B02F1B|nr:hypothetical protein [Xanthomonas arboricola]